MGVEESDGTGSGASLWDEQALEKAMTYLSVGGFSAKSLREQLDHEGFAPTQINYAMANLRDTTDGASLWDEQALQSAMTYLSVGGFSAKSLREQLEHEGFTPTQINYAMANL